MRFVLCLAVVGTLLFAACSGDSGSDDSSDGAATTLVVSTTSGETAETTEAPVETTEAPTTTEAAAETTTTTTAPTTTEAPPTTVDPGPTGLSLSPDGLGALRFGTDADTALEFLGGIFGPANADSGWVQASSSQFGVCPGTEVRGVTFGPLTVLFGDVDGDGARAFHTWTYADNGLGDVFGLQTPSGVGLGSSQDDIAAAAADAEFFEDEIFGETASFQQTFASLDAGTVSYLSGGANCGE